MNGRLEGMRRRWAAGFVAALTVAALVLAEAHAGVVTVQTGVGGSVSGTVNCTSGLFCSSANLAIGTPISLLATPEAGYTFGNPLWTSNYGASSINPLTGSMPLAGDLAVAVNFAPLLPLTVSVSGSAISTPTGSGVSSDEIGTPAQIICGDEFYSFVRQCDTSFGAGTSVTLTAFAGGSHVVFDGWGGACASNGTSPTCTLTIAAASSVSASFSLNTLAVARTGHGSGTVSGGPGLGACEPGCSATYAQGSRVVLRAAPAAGSVFAGWEGGCSGNVPVCAVTMNGAKNVNAVFLPFAAASAVAVGEAHACAVTNAGEVRCWGNGQYGRLGNNADSNRTVPVAVSGLATGAVAVVAGTYHSCALNESGGVLCWGGNGWGQLGVGGISDRLVATPVTGLSSGVAALAAGGIHTCAVTTDGGMKCWGNNRRGQLGNGAVFNGASFALSTVGGLPGPMMAASAGVDHTCALSMAGGVHCWGANSMGELGNGTNADSTVPVAVTGLAGGVVAISSGQSHSCALTTAGEVKCWGRRTKSDPPGSTFLFDSTVPVTVTGLGGPAAAIATGNNHSCSVLVSGAVKCWGDDGVGLGSGGLWSPTPVGVFGLGGGFGAISAARGTCAITTAGGVKCWGFNEAGQIGNASNATARTPAAVSGFGTYFVTVSTGCGVTNAGSVPCWTPTASPQTFGGLTQGIVSESYAAYGCVLGVGGGALCAGYNTYGQLGNGTYIDSATPVPVSNLQSGVAAVSNGYLHNCALTAAGGVHCWGFNDTTQLGVPNGVGGVGASNVPVPVTNLGSGVASLSAGYKHNCVVSTSGGAQCWGLNINRELGSGQSVTGSSTPLAVAGLAAGVRAVSAGASHSCAVTTAGSAYCWGNGFYGQVGEGSSTSIVPTPEAVFGLGANVATLAAGNTHSCASTTAGAVLCWGNNASGELGLGSGTPTKSATPVAVPGLNAGVVSVAANAGSWTCALLLDGTARCWGFAAASSPTPTGDLPRANALDFTSPAGWPSPPPVRFVGATYALAATVRGGAAATFGTVTPDRCSVTGNVVTFLAPGVCRVQAKAGGGTDADPAPTATRTFVVAGNGVRTDLNGDGRADILWRNASTGQVYRMLMSGFSIADAASAYTEPDLAWKVVGDADFNGDRIADLLWRNDATGLVYHQPFAASGLPGTGATVMTEPNPAWKIVHTPDLDGDGNADILWWNSSTGQVWAVLVNGGTILAQGLVYTEPDTAWKIVATGDFAGSGRRNQLLWRHATTGQVYLMTVGVSGGAFSQTGTMIYHEPNTAWKIVGAADFNGDGRGDILWRNEAIGQVFIMLMNGAAINASGLVYTEANLSWKIVAQGDYNGDGRSDLLWRNEATGQVYMMTLDGLSILSGSMIYTEANLAWKILGPWEYGQATSILASMKAGGAAAATLKGEPLNAGRIGGRALNPGARIGGEPRNAPLDLDRLFRRR